MAPSRTVLGASLAALGGAIYLAAPLVLQMTEMAPWMDAAATLAALGLVLLAPVGGFFWLGAGLLRFPRALRVGSDVLGISGLDSAWLTHVGLAAGAVGAVVLFFPRARQAST